MATNRQLKSSRRDFLRMGAASVALSACAGVSSQPPKRPNVLLVFDDQLRADACSVYGGHNITTTYIDQMAAEGATFDNAVSTCPLCTPFRGMLMTGRYPTHSGMLVNFTEVNPNQPCIAHVFRDAGYQTGFIGKWHLSAAQFRHVNKYEGSWKDAQRYMEANPDFNFVPPGPARLGFDHWAAFNFHSAFLNAPYYRDEPKKLTMDQYETDSETQMAIDLMKDCQQRSQPFFITVAPHPPHPPFAPKMCPDGYLERIPPADELHWAPNVPEDHPRRKNAQAIRCYYAMCQNTDDNVGRLLQFLNESGLSEDTIFVLTSDHGEMHGSHNRVNKKVPYAESVNIPMIMRWPGYIPAGLRTDTLHTPMDHMPTLCSLAGLDTPDTVDGADLSRVVSGKGGHSRDEVLMMNHSSHWDFFQTGTEWPEWRGIKTRQYTYVKWLDGREELYDDLEDPYQMKNLAEGNGDDRMLNRNRRRLEDLLADAHDEFLPGTAYGEWCDDERNVVRSGLGPF